jgi:hypothetical protein
MTSRRGTSALAVLALVAAIGVLAAPVWEGRRVLEFGGHGWSVLAAVSVPLAAAGQGAVRRRPLAPLSAWLSAAGFCYLGLRLLGPGGAVPLTLGAIAAVGAALATVLALIDDEP